MTAAIEVVPETMCELIRDSSTFDTANSVINGPWVKTAIQYYPVITVIILGENESAEQTGNVYFRYYSGIIQVDAIMQDIIEIVDRAGTANASLTVNRLVSALNRFFKLSANQNLGNPTMDDGAVYEITLGDGIEYVPAERDNNHTWQANIPFVVQTKETLT